MLRPGRILRRSLRSGRIASNLQMSTSTSTKPTEEETMKESWATKGRRFLQVYGTVGVVTHATLSIASYSILYMSVSKGLDVGAFLGSWTTSVQAAVQSNATEHGNVEAASNLVVTYAIYKMLAPIRWPLTFFVTPMVVRQWNKLRTPKDPKSMV